MFVLSLPMLPVNLPFIKARPRSFGGRSGFTAAFKLNVIKLHRAFLSLGAHNRYYRDAERREDWAADWHTEVVDIGTDCDEDIDNGFFLAMTNGTFDVWVRQALGEGEFCANSFQVGGCVLTFCQGTRPKR